MSIKTKILSIVLGLTLVAVMVPAGSAAAALTSAQVTQIIGLLQAFGADAATLANVQASLTGGSPVPAGPQAAGTGGTGACTGITFTRNLIVGSTGSDVKCLQQILNQSSSTQLGVTGAGSPGNETSYLGPRTLASVRIYQTNNGLVPASQVGPMTRAKLNAYLAGGVVLPPPPGQTGSVSAMLASNTPASAALVGGQARAGLLNVNLSGTGTVTSITLQRSGISTADTLPSVYLYDGATRLTSGNSFNTNGALTFNGLNIAVNGTHEIMVLADVSGSCIADNTCSSVAATMVGFTANGSAVSSNVMGNTMMIVTGTAATADFTTGHTASPAATTINAGSVGQTLWSQNLSVSPRAVMLSGMTVKMIGSAPSNTLANVGLYIDGTLAASTAINANNQYVFSVSSPVTLSTGAHLVEVRGDVVAGATRSFYLSLEQGSDIALKDSQLGIYISATTNGGSTATNISSGLITLGGVGIGGNSITINQNTAFNNTSTVVGGATNVTLASYTFTSYGEDTKVTDITFTPTITGGTDGTNALDTLSNVGLYVNGGQIGSNKTAKTATALEFSNLGSQLTVPLGSPVTVSIKGDVISAATNTVAAGANKTYSSATNVEFDVAAGVTQGISSQALSTLPIAGGQQLSVSSTNVSFTAASGFAAVTAAPNATIELGAWTLSTGSAEGVNVDNVAITFPSGATNTLVTNNQLTNLVLKVNGVVVGSPVGQPVLTSANNFSVKIPVAISSSSELELYGTIGSSSTVYTVTPWMNVTYHGATSNLSTTTGATTGVQTSTGTASIINTGVTFVPSSSLSSQYVTGNGTSTLPIATFNVASNNGVGAVLKDMTFTFAANTVGVITVNGKTGTVINSTSQTIYNTGIVVPSDSSGVNIPVTVKLLCVGQGCNGVSQSTVRLVLTGLTYNNGTATSTVATLPNYAADSYNATSDLKLVGSVPTVSMTGTSTAGLTATAQQIGVFTIAAGSTGDIKVQSVPFTISLQGTSTSITGNTVFLYDANGAVLNGAPTNNGLSGSGTFTFPSTGRTITKGTSETYTVYATINGLGATTGSSSVTFGLGAKGSFLWTDVNGAVLSSNTSIPGTYIYGYPTTVQTKTN